MNLTAKLKSWLTEYCEVKEDAADAQFKTAAGVALAEGKLTADKFAEFTAEEEKELNEFEKKMDAMLTGVSQLIELEKAKAAAKTDTNEEKQMSSENKETKLKTDEMKSVDKVISKAVSTDDGDEKSVNIRVKEAMEQYATTKSAVVFPETDKRGHPHPRAGYPAKAFDNDVDNLQTASERDKAVCGAWLKHLVATRQASGSKTIGYSMLQQHDKELLQYGMKNMKWSGSSDVNDRDCNDIDRRFLTSLEQRSLIDDSTSGGLEAAPIVFDDDVIQTPLLHGELFPLVSVKPIDRGRRIEGVVTGTVSRSWGGVDDSSISLFTTTSYVTAFDTTIFRWEGSIQIGLDFLSDTPIDFMTHISQQYGQKLMESLDDVIATGNGSTQPEGVINKSGATSISFGGTTSIGAYESLRYGVAKPEHKSNLLGSAVFCGTETSWERVRALPVGAADARRLFGMGHFTQDYNLAGAPYKLNETMTNAQIFYAVLARYRMYRRRGLTLRTSTEGDTLIRKNLILMVATARYGGQLERGAVAAITTDAPV